MSKQKTAIDEPKVRACADYIRYLALEAIEKANSGHPGMPLGCAIPGTLLFRYLMRYNPQDPQWLNRDRFVLSAGHGSMLLYSLLHLAGYSLSLEDLDRFRQWGSHTPGHPEFDLIHGVETSTGPLGQGFANAVGMAIEGKRLAQRFNRNKFNLIDYHVFVLLGDGCMMEGVTNEAASLAGHLGLDNLIAVYDANRITIDGGTNLSFTEHVGRRFEALGWTVEVGEESDLEGFCQKVERLKSLRGKPKLLILETVIGSGLEKKKDTSAIHGSPAGVDEIAYFIQNCSIRSFFENQLGAAVVGDRDQLKQALKNRLEKKDPLLSYPEAAAFIQEEQTSQQKYYQEWQHMVDSLQETSPSKSRTLAAFISPKLSKELRQTLLGYKEEKSDSTRNIFGRVLNLCYQEFPQLMGGSADLAGSCKAQIENEGIIRRDNYDYPNIAYGVREHAMGAVGNGLALGGRFVPFSGTFLTFFDYMKPAVRLAALMKLNHLFVYSHDSIFLGEDGPTHQPIEHINALRLIPDLLTFRPCDARETAWSMLYFLDKLNGPVALITSRQNIAPEILSRKHGEKAPGFPEFCLGGYVYYESAIYGPPQVLLLASGSEVGLGLQALLLLEKEQIKGRVISIPCLDLLSRQPVRTRHALLTAGKAPVFLIEAASHRGLATFYNEKMTVIDIQSFGFSAPAKKVANHFGFTPDKIAERIKERL